MKHSTLALVFAGSAALAACGGGGGGGGGGDGTTTATGTYGGSALEFHNALSGVYNDSKGSLLAVVLEKLGTCADAGGGAGAVADDEVVFIGLYSVPDLNTKTSVAATAPGTYSLDVTSAGPFASIDVTTLDGSCNSIAATSGSYDSGTVTVTSIDGTVVTGSINATDTAGDTLTGSFTSASCAAIATSNSGSATCAP